jgi:hypothetical protein
VHLTIAEDLQMRIGIKLLLKTTANKRTSFKVMGATRREQATLPQLQLT